MLQPAASGTCNTKQAASHPLDEQRARRTAPLDSIAPLFLADLDDRRGKTSLGTLVSKECSALQVVQSARVRLGCSCLFARSRLI